MIMPILTVKDITASYKFYTEILGFKESVGMKDDSGNDTFFILTFGSSDIGIGIDPDVQPDQVGASVQFMVYVPETMDIDQYHADVKARGGAAADIKTEYWGDRLFDIKDPNGYLLSLCKTVKMMTRDDATANNITLAEPL